MSRGYLYGRNLLRKATIPKQSSSPWNAVGKFVQRNYTGSSLHVPSAYRFRRENNFRRDSHKHEASSHLKERKYEDLRNLSRLENEAKTIMKLYEAALTRGSMPTAITDSMTPASSAQGPLENKAAGPISWEQLEELTTSLHQSEDKYRHLCVKLRQIIAGWSSIRPTSTNDLNKFRKHFTQLSGLIRNRIMDGNTLFKDATNPSPLEHVEEIQGLVYDHKNSHGDHHHQATAHLHPAKRAEEYLTLLDDLRMHRAWMIQIACSECYTYQRSLSLESHPTQDSIGKNIVTWMKSLYHSIRRSPSHGPVTHNPIFTHSPTLDLSLLPNQDTHVLSLQHPYTRILTSLQALKAHESSNFTSTVRLYKEVMKSYIHWHGLLVQELSSAYRYKQDEKKTTTQTDDSETPETEAETIRLDPTIVSSQYQKLCHELDRLLEIEKHNYHVRKNVNVLPDREMYHIVMKQHARMGTVAGALRVIHLLREMKEAAEKYTPPTTTDLSQSMDSSSSAGPKHDTHTPTMAESTTINMYEPTLQSYGIALRACRNFVSSTYVDHIDNKLLVVNHAMDLLQEIESLRVSKGWAEGEDGKGTEPDHFMALVRGASTYEPTDPTWSPRFLLLSILNLAGHKVIHNLCSQVDSLLIQFIGEEAFLILVGEKESNSSTDIKIDLSICHLVIEIYNRKKEKRYADRAKAILRYMEETVKDYKSNFPYPNQNTYNSVIRSLHIERTLGNAQAATGLLDSMSRRQSSMPDRSTFNGILNLWTCSNSEQAGEKASAILARMELHNLLLTEPSTCPTFRTYELTLRCWSLAAMKGYPSAAKRAYGILKSMEAQCSSIVVKETAVESRLRGKVSKVYHNELRPESIIYSHVINTCSQTTKESDKAEAIQIAFDVYKRLMDRKVPPTKMMYLHLIQCCNLLPDTMVDQRQMRLNTILDSMIDEYRRDRDISQAIQAFDGGM